MLQFVQKIVGECALKNSWKVLLVDLLWEKNVIPSLKKYGWKDKWTGLVVASISKYSVSNCKLLCWKMIVALMIF
jgi:hypothetical protein